MGILLAMGFVKLPKFHDYWARNVAYALPWFSNIMPRNSFLQILPCLYLRNNQEQPTREHPEYKLYKLGNFSKLLNEVFAKRYKPNQAPGEISYYNAGRRPAKMNEVLLVGKHGNIP